MPFPLYIAALTGLMLVNVLLAGVLLWLSARAFRLREFRLKHGLAVAAAYAIVNATAIIVGRGMFNRDEPVYTAALLGLIGTLAVLKLIGKRGWVRTVGALVVFTIMSGVVGLGVAAASRATVFDPYLIPTGSMAPTVEAGDRLLVDRTLTPRRWDIVAFRTPENPKVIFIARLIALPGETVEIIDGEITINGSRITKPAGMEAIRYDGLSRKSGRCRGGTGSPFTLGAGEHFVLGDNTDNAWDSRYWSAAPAGVQPGAVPAELIIGTVRCTYAPLGRMRVFR